MNYYFLFKYIGTAAIVLLLAGLLGWYFFLRNQTGEIANLDEARGFSIAVPSFTGSRSSTAENIASGAGTESLLSAVQTGENRPPRLWKVSTTPVAGAGFVMGSSTLRFVERSTGHVYDVNPATGSTVRVTKELFPKVYDATIVGTSTVVMRTLDDAGMPTALLGELGTSTDDGFTDINTSNLGGNIRSLVASPNTPQIAMLATGDGMTHLVRARANGTSPQQLLSLGVGSFSIDWLADGRLFLTELPGSGIAGNAYEVVQGALNPLLRGLPGLMINPRSSSSGLLFSIDDGNRVQLFVQPSAQASTTPLSIQTLADKCVWAPASAGTSTPTLAAYCASPQSALPSNFIDGWLRGAIHTSDAWFTIDATAAKADRFFVPESTVALDVERPMIDSSGEYIAFMNARDKSLWILRIKE